MASPQVFPTNGEAPHLFSSLGKRGRMKEGERRDELSRVLLANFIPLRLKGVCSFHLESCGYCALRAAFCCSARRTFSAVTGTSNSRTPHASSTALAIAAGGATLACSPMPFASYGPGPFLPPFTSTVLNFGISRMLGILYSPRFVVVTF